MKIITKHFKVSVVLKAMKNIIGVLLCQEAKSGKQWFNVTEERKTSQALLIISLLVFYLILTETLKDKHYQTHICK